MRPSCPRAAIGELAAIASLLCSLGCSSETSERSPNGPPAGPATATEIDQLCGAQCTHSTQCNPPAMSGDPPTTCPTSCKEKLGNLATAIREDIVRSLTTCYATLPCGTNDDRCLGDAVIASGESLDAALHAPDVTSCLQKVMECHDMTGDVFSDDNCGTLAALIAGKRAEAAHCFTLPCEAVPQCLTPIFGR